MEKIAGANLQDWLKNRGRPISQEQALNWLKQLSEILDQVHRLNYFHRDIKPHNIMCKPNGQLVLIDFGTAREVSATYFAKVGQGQNVLVLFPPATRRRNKLMARLFRSRIFLLWGARLFIC